MLNSKEYKMIINDLGRNLIRDEIIKTANKSKAQIRLEVQSYISKNLAPLGELEISIDYRKGLLSNARCFLRNNDFHSAIVFYSQWIEHWFNHIILRSLKIKNINEKYFKDIVSIKPLRVKYTWLWDLLNLKPLNANHLKIIEKVFENRNAFVHYRWTAHKHRDVKNLIKQLNDLKALSTTIDKTIVYLNNYESRHVYKGYKNIFN